MNTVKELEERALSQVSASEDLRVLDDLRVQYLGKKGEVTALLKSLGGMEPEERKSFGQAVNATRDAVNQAIQARKAALETQALEQKSLMHNPSASSRSGWMQHIPSSVCHLSSR